MEKWKIYEGGRTHENYMPEFLGIENRDELELDLKDEGKVTRREVI